MKKKILLLFLTIFCLFSLFGCKNKIESVRTLRIYNWQDYIDEGLDDDGEKISQSVMEDWAKDYYERTGEKVNFVYNTFETNEYMLNVLKTGSEHYDLVCPSDYVIQKMIAENMLEKLDYNSINGYKYINNFNDYGSPFIKNLFETHTATNKTTKEELSWSNYAIPYMWGTMGFVYDSNVVDDIDAQTWGILWNKKYSKKSTAKNSVHDTYVAGALYTFRDELDILKQKYENSEKTIVDRNEYSNAITEIINRTDSESLNKIEKSLIEMKNNFYGFEVDNGKTDILGGTITINFAWSGDAVYSIYTADEALEENPNGPILKYAVPLEGSNVWFDGWVMPKGSDTELAQDFLNFLCTPEVACRNMDTIGYTSSIAGNEVWERCNDEYGVTDASGEVVDLSYFFKGTIDNEYLTDGKCLIKVLERNRSFDAQYPEEDVIARCGIMEDFGDDNSNVLLMWENVKCGEIEGWLIAGIIMLIIFVILVILYSIWNNKNLRKKRRLKR